MKMKKHSLFLTITVLCTALFAAFTYDYDVTIPPDTGESPTRGAERIREIKLAVQERENVDHYWPLTSNEVSDANSGQHRQITLYGPIATPTEVVNKAFLYTKDVNSVVELFWLDEEGHERQLTTEGSVYLISSDIVGKLANDTWFTAIDSVGTGTVNLIKANDSNTPELAADANLPTGTTIDVNDPDNRIVNKAYVDNSVKSISDMVIAVNDISIDSTSYVDMTNMEISLSSVTADADVLFQFTGSLRHASAGADIWISISIDDGSGSYTDDKFIVQRTCAGGSASDRYPTALSFLATSVTGGTVKAKIRWKVSTGTGYQDGSVAGRNLIATVYKQ